MKQSIEVFMAINYSNGEQGTTSLGKIPIPKFKRTEYYADGDSIDTQLEKFAKQLIPILKERVKTSRR